MGVRKNTKLRTLFIQFVVVLGIFIIILAPLNYLLLVHSSPVTYPANYSETVIHNNLKRLKESAEVDETMLSPMSTFGVYSDRGEFLYGSFPDEEKNKIWNTYITGKKSMGLKNYIAYIQRQDEILLIKYPLVMQYKNARLRALLPNPEKLAFILFLIEFIIGFILISNRFANKINRELKSLLLVAAKIEAGDLEFDVAKSKIEEINTVLQGIHKMKESLKIALKEQWRVEQQKREQIAALSHDIKTPLTIVKGNVELLKETQMTDEQEKYCGYIYDSSARMETYIQSLLRVTRDEQALYVLNEKIYLSELLDFLKHQGASLSRTKNIEIIWKKNIAIEKNLYIEGHREELERALMNIITNAVNYSPEEETIEVISTLDKEQWLVQVIDRGSGFSPKMLKYGKEKFVMSDESRSKNERHGLGLYIADSIIKKYNGEIMLCNHAEHGGLVSVKIPISRIDVASTKASTKASTI